MLCFIYRAVGVAARAAIAAVLPRRPHRPPYTVQAVVSWHTRWALRTRRSIDTGVAARSVASWSTGNTLFPSMAVVTCGREEGVSKGDGNKKRSTRTVVTRRARRPGDGAEFFKRFFQSGQFVLQTAIRNLQRVKSVLDGVDDITGNIMVHWQLRISGRGLQGLGGESAARGHKHNSGNQTRRGTRGEKKCSGAGALLRRRRQHYNCVRHLYATGRGQNT
jgi:hypothetical protein